ncbi:hypothetical protein AP75_12355 [Kaistella haifensis DSM 19056]|uniref:Uncharacterized protein n=1 Tax=Kaistella haifensis DSM 19056 TaxID=1450526 RepID=A0A246B759_9FLAO|nr:hypothetical protein AP75_12355 [Kaistella haifensis DSM 19056]
MMLKVIVFLYQYYLEVDKSEKLAYLRVMGWFFVVFGVFFTTSLLNFFSIKIPIIGELHQKGRMYGYLEGFLVSLPYFLLFYIFYPPKKLQYYKGKFTYPQNYIWYLRIGFVLYIVLWMLISSIR